MCANVAGIIIVSSLVWSFDFFEELSTQIFIKISKVELKKLPFPVMGTIWKADGLGFRGPIKLLALIKM
jgi:hypothetical protein